MLTMLFSLTACGDGVNQPPEIKVTAGGQKLAVFLGMNKWNGSVYDRADTFMLAAAQGEDIPYIELGSTISIELGEQPSDYVLQDFILNDDGTVKYTDNWTGEIDLKLKKGKGAFVLEVNPAAMLSSASATYEPGGVLRGFRLTCSFGIGNECEYAFVLRTDATE